MDQKTEIRSYIKCRIRLNIESKQRFMSPHHVRGGGGGGGLGVDIVF